MSAPAERLAAVIQELARARDASAPAPRALPYLGLEHASGTGFHLLDALSSRGIFRKYELVLDLGAGLGGTSRWLAMRLGCEVVGTSADLAEARAGTALSRRARLTTQVCLVPARPATLPFRTGRFTHAWILEALSRLRDAGAAVAEAFRLVRPGGTLAVQDLFVRDDAGVADVPGRRFLPLQQHVDALREAGFVDLQVRDRTADAAERSAQVVVARDLLMRRLGGEPTLAAALTEREGLGRALGDGRLGVFQVLAGRP